MGGKGRKNKPAEQPEPAPATPVHIPADDDDFEDGDFATPKHEHHGNDDEPL